MGSGYDGGMDVDKHERRLIAIEEKIAFFEKYAADLNESVLELSKRLERVRGELKRAEARFAEAMAKSEGAGDPADEKPPHY